MPTNATIAALFEEMAALLELTGANGFKVNAAAKVARVVEDLDGDLAAIVEDPGALEKIDAFGGGVLCPVPLHSSVTTLSGSAAFSQASRLECLRLLSIRRRLWSPPASPRA